FIKKNHNKYNNHNQKPVDRNDPRSKIKGTVLEIVDPENLENKILHAIYRCSYEDLNDLANCIWCTPEYCSRCTFARYDSESRPFHYILENYKKKPNNSNGNNQYTKENSSEKIMDDLFVENKSDDEIIVENMQDNPRW
ncbi:36944_t:CDS:1, partial [Racocetra persica]